MGKMKRRPSGTPRQRTPNWSPQEKHFLLQLIKDRKEAVIATVGHSQEKVTAWREILEELSTKYGDKFALSSIKKVKTQWQNMRRIARDEITAFGANLDRYTLQSLEVCHVLGLVKDGALTEEADTMNSFVRVKTERMDDDFNQPGVSGMNMNTSTSCHTPEQEINQANLAQEQSTSSMSEQYSDDEDSMTPDQARGRKDVSAMTEPMIQDTPHIGFVHREMQEFLRYTALQKQLKMDCLKEERLVMKAMRDTAELNKIVAEQKLKHILWVKKQEMAMYSGEPGSGAGKGGGGGGAIRSAGGAFGKMEAAREDEYFYRKQKEQLSNLKGHLNKEISFHQEQIKRHEDAIRRHKEQMDTMDKH